MLEKKLVFLPRNASFPAPKLPPPKKKEAHTLIRKKGGFVEGYEALLTPYTYYLGGGGAARIPMI